MKILLLLLFFGLFVSAGFLFHMKHQVVMLERRQAFLERKSYQIQQEINLLTSELSYLSNPQRIYQLICRHLPEYRPLMKKQLFIIPKE